MEFGDKVFGCDKFNGGKRVCGFVVFFVVKIMMEVRIKFVDFII